MFVSCACYLLELCCDACQADLFNGAAAPVETLIRECTSNLLTLGLGAFLCIYGKVLSCPGRLTLGARMSACSSGVQTGEGEFVLRTRIFLIRFGLLHGGLT